MGTLSNEISAILDDIDDSYAALAEQGATLPAAANQGTSQLPGTIATIPRPALNAPSISRSNDTISISNPSANGNFASTFKIYNGTVLRGTTTQTSFTLTGLGAGSYELSVKATGANFTDSPKSNMIKASVYTITRTLTNLTANNSTALIADGMPYSVTLSPTSGYYLPEDITVTIGGKAYTKFTYDSYTGALTIPAANGNVEITAVADTVNRLRRPTVVLSGSMLTVTPPRYAETTNVYINGTLKYTISGTTAQTYDISADYTAYGVYAIHAISTASGYTESYYGEARYTVGATIAINNGIISIVDIISGVTGFRVYIDGARGSEVAYDGSSSWSLDMSEYEESVEDGKHTVELCALGTGIADNRSNAVTWFVGTSPIYGVSGLYASAPALTRTDDAEGMSFTINNSSGAIASDFNDVFPWNVAEVVDDDAGKFVSFPEMYFRIGVDSNGRMTDVAVSAQPSNEGTWYKVDPFMYGCYGASVANNKMRSVSGVERTNYSRAKYRTRAFNNGEGYLPIDLYHRNVLMLLWWIEFATKKSDSIMTGRIAYSGTSGGSSRRPCGGTDSVPTPSGFETAYAQMRYHYIEDFIGNVWEMVDGIYMNNVGQYDYVTADPTKFSDTTDGKAALSYVNPSNNEIAAYGWDPDNPFLFMPIETVSNNSYNTYFCDRVYHNSGCPVMLAGARYNDSNANYGLSYVNYTNASNNNANYGSRHLVTRLLTFIEHGYIPRPSAKI